MTPPISVWIVRNDVFERDNGKIKKKTHKLEHIVPLSICASVAHITAQPLSTRLEPSYSSGLRSELGYDYNSIGPLVRGSINKLLQ